ncbi:MAG TPA: hypothetical protein VFN97_25160 [Actinospica sp.]|nr:hypothetical protein [Actinospica sp.]
MDVTIVADPQAAKRLAEAAFLEHRALAVVHPSEQPGDRLARAADRPAKDLAPS